MARTSDPVLNERRRTEILEAAIRCILKKGFHQSSMREICQEAGMSAGAVYRYFDSKQSIIEEIAAIERDENSQIIKELDDSHDFIESIRQIMKEILAFYADPDQGRLDVEIMGEAVRNPKVAGLFNRNEQEFRTALANAIHKARLEGQISPTIEPDQGAEMLLILVDGLSSRAILDPDYDPGKLEKMMERLMTRFFET